MPDLSTPRAKRLILVLVALIVLGWVFWQTRDALAPFFVGAALAYLLAPLVDFIQVRLRLPRRLGGASRALSVVIAYLIAISVLVIAGFYLVPPLFDQTTQFIRDVPTYWDDLQSELAQLNDYYETSVPESLRMTIEDNLGTATAGLSEAAQRFMMVTFDAVGTVVGVAAGLALLPLWMFYILKDQREGVAWFYGLWPESWRSDVRAIVGIIDNVLSAYIRVQLLLGVIIGVVTGLAMWVIGIQQALVLGLLAGILELIPVLGPWIAFVIAGIVALATSPDKFFLVALAFLGIQQLENTFLVPNLQGDAVRMNPAVIMVLLVVGSALWGIVGMIIIVPLAAVLRDVFVYLYLRTGDDALPLKSD